MVLGFTQVSWDNLSGGEPQPKSWDKFWNELSVNEQAAIVLLGYNEKTWNNDSYPWLPAAIAGRPRVPPEAEMLRLWAGRRTW